METWIAVLAGGALGIALIGSIVTAGYFFGNIPVVKANLEKIIWAMILIPGVVVVYGAWKAGRDAKVQSPVKP